MKRLKKHLKNHSFLYLIALFALIVCALWLGAVRLFHDSLTESGGNPDYWAMTEALSTAVATVVVIGAGLIAYKELSEVANSRHIEVADKLFQELNSPANIEARRWVFENLKEPPETFVPKISDDDQAKIKQVLNSLDRVSFLTQSGWIPDDVIMPWMHPMISKSWDKLEPYVLYERERRGESYYYKYAEEVARRCRKWREKNLPVGERENKWIDNAL